MNKVSEHLKSTFSGVVLESSFDQRSKQEMIYVPAEKIRDVLRILKTELMFDMLIDILGIDWQDQKTHRFEVSYLFYNTKDNTRVHIRTLLPNNEKPEIESVMDLYPAADWAERECWDMYGIHFAGHPKLERLLTWEGFEGHPLRKDFKIDKRQPIPVLQKLL